MFTHTLEIIPLSLKVNRQISDYMLQFVISHLNQENAKKETVEEKPSYSYLNDMLGLPESIISEFGLTEKELDSGAKKIILACIEKRPDWIKEIEQSEELSNHFKIFKINIEETDRCLKDKKSYTGLDLKPDQWKLDRIVRPIIKLLLEDQSKVENQSKDEQQRQGILVMELQKKLLVIAEGKVKKRNNGGAFVFLQEYFSKKIVKEKRAQSQLNNSDNADEYFQLKVLPRTHILSLFILIKREKWETRDEVYKNLYQKLNTYIQNKQSKLLNYKEINPNLKCEYLRQAGQSQLLDLYLRKMAPTISEAENIFKNVQKNKQEVANILADLDQLIIDRSFVMKENKRLEIVSPGKYGVFSSSDSVVKSTQPQDLTIKKMP